MFAIARSEPKKGNAGAAQRQQERDVVSHQFAAEAKEAVDPGPALPARRALLRPPVLDGEDMAERDVRAAAAERLPERLGAHALPPELARPRGGGGPQAQAQRDARDEGLERARPGQEKSAKFPTSKAPLSVVFHSFRLILGRAIISRSALDARMLFPERARGTLMLKRT